MHSQSSTLDLSAAESATAAKPNVVLLKRSARVSPAARSRLKSSLPGGPPAVFPTMTR